MIVRIEGVKRVRSKGRDYFYHRKTMKRLPGKPGSAVFMARLRELDDREAIAAAIPRSLGAVIVAYRQSPEWARLAPATHAYYQKVFDRLQPKAAVPVRAIDSAMLYELRDVLAAERKRSFANAAVKVLRLLFSWAVKRNMMTANPAAGVDMIARPRNAPLVNRPWKPVEFDAVMAAFPSWLRVPIALAAYTGLREQDLVRVTWACYDGAAFETRSQKTNVLVWAPAHYRLREVLDATPRRSPVIVTGARGRPLSLSGLRNSFYRYLAPLIASGTVAPGLSIHGLRHTLGTALAETGCDAATIASLLGHETTRMAEHYSRRADRRHLASAGIERLENRTRKTNGKTIG